MSEKVVSGIASAIAAAVVEEAIAQGKHIHIPSLGIFKVSRAHDLKCWPAYFEALLIGVKHFELRNNDRDFQVNDLLFIHEYDPDLQAYTGRSLSRRVSFVVTEGPWLTPGYAALSLQEVL